MFIIILEQRFLRHSDLECLQETLSLFCFNNCHLYLCCFHLHVSGGGETCAVGLFDGIFVLVGYLSRQ